MHDVTVPLTEILEANCSYVGENDFGVLQSSKLVLRGRILECFVKQNSEGSLGCSICLRDGDAWARFVANGLSNLQIIMDMDHDGALSIPSWQEFYFLEVSEYRRGYPDSPSTDANWNFLLLSREDQDGFVYTRAGVATLERRYSVT